MTAVEVRSRPQSKEGKLIASNTLHSVLLLSIDNSKSLAFLAAVVISVLCSWELEAKALELDESGFRFAMLVLSCPTLCDPMDYNLPVSSVHGISRHEYWSRLPSFSRGSS